MIDVRIDGKVSADKRMINVDRFNDPNSGV